MILEYNNKDNMYGVIYPDYSKKIRGIVIHLSNGSIRIKFPDYDINLSNEYIVSNINKTSIKYQEYNTIICKLDGTIWIRLENGDIPLPHQKIYSNTYI